LLDSGGSIRLRFLERLDALLEGFAFFLGFPIPTWFLLRTGPSDRSLSVGAGCGRAASARHRDESYRYE
jgi:hypothetical protein